MLHQDFGRVVAIGAAAALLSFAAVPAIAADAAGRGTSIDDWKGLTVLQGGKGYVQAPLGQMHYRDVGPRSDKSPIILMHQSPMSMIQWADVQNALVAQGHRVITVDTPGNGLSDLPNHQPTIAEFADNLVALLDQLKIKKAVMGGHHTGAQIATAFAARHPERVQALVLHGAAMFSDEELAKLQAGIGKGKGTGRLPTPDGAQYRSAFGNDLNEKRQEILTANTWLRVTSLLTGPDIGHFAAFHYQMRPDLMAVKAPTLLLSDTADSVNVIDKQVAAMRPDFKYVEFSNGNYMELMAQPQKWADIVGPWVKANAKP